MAMLKMNENVNLRLERHVNRALFYYLLWILSYFAATATAKAMLKMDENVNLRLERDVNRALFYCLLYIVSYLAATVMATAMLKMDENVNLRLQWDVNQAFFCCLRLFSWERFEYFSKYSVAKDWHGNANGKFKLVTITQFTKLEWNGYFIISGRKRGPFRFSFNTGFTKCVITP